jgi:RES domain-containing protein
VNYDRDVLQALARFPAIKWEGIVYRHMFANYPPDRENTLGARWNPPEVPAIYTSLSRDTVLAESEYQISLEPLRPRAKRILYQISVVLSAVLNFSSRDALNRVGLSTDDVSSMDHSSCQAIGGAVEYLGHDGLLIPSARDINGTNLVIYPNRITREYEFEIVGREIIFDPDQT